MHNIWDKFQNDPSDNRPDPSRQVYKDVLKTLYQALHNMYSATILSSTNESQK